MIGKTNVPIIAKKKLATTIRINQTITSPAKMITRIVDDGGIEAIRANSHRYTGTFANNVMTLRQLDDNDGTKYADGSNASLTTLGTDVWMKLPKFYWKCTEYAIDMWDFSVVYGEKPDNTYKEWDGNDLIGVYEGYRSSSKLYSSSGRTSTGSVSQANFKKAATNRGAGFSLVKWKHHCMMAMLFYTQYNDTNSQKKVGFGSGSITSKTGTTNSLGMNDSVGRTDENIIVNFWGLENWWGNKDECLDNIAYDNGNHSVIVDYDSSGSEREISLPSNLTDGYARKFMFGEYADLLPKSSSSSSTTGFCDLAGLEQGAGTIELCPLIRSGSYSDDTCGVSCLSYSGNSGQTSSNRTSRLAYRGDWVEV